MTLNRTSTIFFNSELRERWPLPLASMWFELYPQLFDADDVRIATEQPRNHFCEWLSAIYLFHRDGACSLVEKYAFGSHPRKHQVLAQLLKPTQLEVRRSITQAAGVQPPDLLAFHPKSSQFWFAEVKGPSDRLRPSQEQSHTAIRDRLGVPVEIIVVKRCDA